MQGQLTAPFTYDVQNIHDKKLTVLLPDDKTPRAVIKLKVKYPERILGVWVPLGAPLGIFVALLLKELLLIVSRDQRLRLILGYAFFRCRKACSPG